MRRSLMICFVFAARSISHAYPVDGTSADLHLVAATGWASHGVSGGVRRSFDARRDTSLTARPIMRRGLLVKREADLSCRSGINRIGMLFIIDDTQVAWDVLCAHV